MFDKLRKALTKHYQDQVKAGINPNPFADLESLLDDLTDAGALTNSQRYTIMEDVSQESLFASL